MKRLWVQQTLAFSLVVIVTMGAVAIWINQSADAEFRKYVTLREMQTPGSGLQELVDVLSAARQLGRCGKLAGGRRLSLATTGRHRLGRDVGRAMLEPEEERRQPDVLLADAGGRVVFDSAGQGERQAVEPRRDGQRLAHHARLTTGDSDRLPAAVLSLSPRLWTSGNSNFSTGWSRCCWSAQPWPWS